VVEFQRDRAPQPVGKHANTAPGRENVLGDQPFSQMVRLESASPDEDLLDRPLGRVRVVTPSQVRLTRKMAGGYPARANDASDVFVVPSSGSKAESSKHTRNAVLLGYHSDEPLDCPSSLSARHIPIIW
jgi:hypothetical protein